MVRTILGDGLDYVVLSGDKDYKPIEPYDFVSHYYVERICFEFPSEDAAVWTVKCYCRKQPCSRPIVAVPRFRFWFSIKNWLPKEACDFIEILPHFFDKWSKEMWTINHEIPKIKKMREIKMLRSEMLGMRKIESYIESRYQGECEKNEEEVSVTIQLNEKWFMCITTQIVCYIPNWWERTLEIVDTFVEYLESQIEDNNLFWVPYYCELNCNDGRHWYTSYLIWDITEDLKALTASKKRWLKLMPMVVDIYI